MSRRVVSSSSSSSANSSSSAGGTGNKRGREVTSASVDFLLTACNNQLETLAKRIKNQCKDLPVDNVNEWREKVVQISKDSASLSNAVEVTKRVLETELERFKNKQARQDEGSSSSSAPSSASSSSADAKNETAASIAGDINNLIATSKKSFDLHNAPLVKKIVKIVAIDDGDQEEDIVMVDETLTEESFKCPVTYKTIVEPMKNGECCHCVSKEGIMGLLRGKSQVDCFMSGCTKKWSLTNLVPNAEYEDKMNRFFRLHKQQSAIASAHHMDDAIAVDDDDDADYAQV